MPLVLPMLSGKVRVLKSNRNASWNRAEQTGGGVRKRFDCVDVGLDLVGRMISSD
jgi:hypothetical protein